MSDPKIPNPPEWFIATNSDGQISAPRMTIPHIGHVPVLPVFTAHEKAEGFIDRSNYRDRDIRRLQPEAFGELLDCMLGAGVEWAGVDPTGNTVDTFQIVRTELLRKRIAFVLTFPCFVLDDPRPSRGSVLGGIDERGHDVQQMFVGIFSKQEHATRYSELTGIRICTREVQNAAELLTVLDKCPPEVKQYLIDPIYGSKAREVIGDLGKLREKLRRLAAQAEG